MHTTYFRTLVGKTVKDVQHIANSGDEAIEVTFTDGTKFKVWSYGQYLLDARINDDLSWQP